MVGILNINKPQEMTSFDVVAILRKKLGVKRIGHLGTLDPMAEGVLPVAIGKATRIMEYLDGDLKEYVGEFIFGISSDTDDIWGEEIRQKEKPIISRDDIEEAIKSFTGVITQTPPKYAAIKIDGRKLYEYARAGEEVDIKSRNIYIERFDILDFGNKYVAEVEKELPYVIARIICSKGTYIRSIARDLGKALGTCGLMSGLQRRRNGCFDIEEAIDIDTIRNMEEKDIEKLLLNMEDALTCFPEVHLSGWEAKLFSNGVPLEKGQWQKPDKALGRRNFPLGLPESYKDLYKVFGDEGFLGIGYETPEGGLKADKILL